MVSTLVWLAASVLLALSQDQRSRCDRETIVTALKGLTGSDTVHDLRDMIEEDPDSVKLAAVAIPLSLFFARLKQALKASSSEPAVVGDGGAAGDDSQPVLNPGVAAVRGCGGCAHGRVGVESVREWHAHDEAATEVWQ